MRPPVDCIRSDKMVATPLLKISGLLVTGCSDDRAVTRDIYLLAMLSTNTTMTEGFQIRVGYFGICVQKSGSDEWNCNKGTTSSQFSGIEDPLQLLSVAQKFRDEVVFPGLM